MPETATEYGKAHGVGEGVRTCGVPREELFVVSKVAAEHKTYEEAKVVTDETLKKMGLDEGSIREDDLFNILHEEKFEIAGLEVDINPITEDKTGSLAEYLESAELFMKEKAQEKKLEKLSVKEKDKTGKADVTR